MIDTIAPKGATPESGQSEEPSRPATSSQSKSTLSCPLDMSHVLIMDFVALLEHQAGGQSALDMQTLRSCATVFLDRLRHTTRAPDDCLRMHERLLWDERRRFPFERLVIRRFAHLFPKRVGDDGVSEGAVLSRRAIPGIAVAMTKMMGLDQYKAFDAQIHTILHAHKLTYPGPVDWALVADRADVRRVIDQALLTMTGYFAELGKRVPWLIEVVNSHLGPPAPEDGSTIWAMNSARAIAFLNSLYDDLIDRLKQDRRGMERIYGVQAIHSLAALDEALAQVEDAFDAA